MKFTDETFTEITTSNGVIVKEYTLYIEPTEGVELESTRLFVRVSIPQDGKAEHKGVVLEHGMWGTGETPGVITWLYEAMREICVVCRPDVSGNGKSSGEWNYSGHEMEARDIWRCVQMLKERFGVKATAAVGHSKGATDAIIYGAHAAEDKEEPLCIVSIASKTVYGRGSEKTIFTEEQLQECKEKGFFMWSKFHKVWKITQKSLDDRLALTTNIIKYIEGLEKVHWPLLCVQGTADDVCNMKNADVILQHAPTTTEMCLIEGAGHYFRGFQDELCSRIVEWLRSHGCL